MKREEPILPLGRGRATAETSGRMSTCGCGRTRFEAVRVGCSQSGGTSEVGVLCEVRPRKVFEQEQASAPVPMTEQPDGHDTLASDTGVMRARCELLTDVAALGEIDCAARVNSQGGQ